MKVRAIPPRAFLKTYEALMERSARELSSCAKDPTPRRVHAARAAIRRSEAAFDLLPKESRPKGTKEYSTLLHRFVSASNALSDCDAFGRVLSSLDESRGRGARLWLARRRRKKSGEAAKAAEGAVRRRPAVLEAGAIRRGMVDARLRKRVGDLIGRVEEASPRVVSDSSKVYLLHKMRRDCRQLRYLLAFAQSGDETSTLVKRLVELQDLLGAVRDLDVAAKLSAKGSRDLEGLHAARDRAFSALVSRVEEMTEGSRTLLQP